MGVNDRLSRGTYIGHDLTMARYQTGALTKHREAFTGLKEFQWGDSFWVDGYYAETVEKVDESVGKRYIGNQSRL